MSPVRTDGLFRVALLSLLGAALGCGQVNAYRTKAPEPGKNEGNWAALRDASTRRAQLYDQFSHRATITATYLSPEVREARARRLGEWLGWTDQELSARLAAEAAEATKYDDFMLALYTADRHDNDLDAHQSIWRLSLRLDGDQLVSHEVRFVDPNATVQNLFPYVSPFDNVYRARFDHVTGKPLAERTFVLEISSALGKMELTFGDGKLGPDRPEGTPIP
ncbi:MAG TPA: hypothetical protein VFG59_21480 [Anaeromyxobacter sp.]|nr:hypothetical protein [Anaeromyxobacter sp.]